MDHLEALLDRAKAALNEEDYELLDALVGSHVYLTQLLDDKRITIARLRKLLFGSGSERTSDVVKPQEGDAGTSQAASSETVNGEDGAAATEQTSEEDESTSRPDGHGRHGADAYEGAKKIRVSHACLKSGDSCPDCKKGKVYEVAQPGVLVRIVGQAPLQATVYELQKLRCNLCGKVFTADAPKEVGLEKYDATSASMIALLKYGSGLPFNRLEGLQGSLGIPLPASTQWDIVKEAARKLRPVYDELIRQAADGEVLYNDDTTMKILEFMGKRARNKVPAENAGQHRAEDPAATEDAPQRTGVFTSGIVSTRQGRRIALFFTGRRHAGENLAAVLRHRAGDLSAPIQMCDALSRNEPKAFETLLANCNAHGRRQFVDVAENFPAECRHVLEVLRDVYKNDDIAKERNLSPQERLAFHQAQSRKLMDDLQTWLTRQLEERRVEPNSGLGQAITYMLKHWKKLTLFLREPGAPLDNNITERALKLAILHRKNALFYKTQNGAQVGDLFMSLIHTCHLGGVNPFDYLTELRRHADELPRSPSAWMPWIYRQRIEAAAAPAH